jgi:hypothetical protein
MNLTKLILFAVLAISCSAVAAQTVVITPRKTVYRRPKPQIDFKKTFTIRRPDREAATPALSHKITTAISPEKVLELNIARSSASINGSKKQTTKYCSIRMACFASSNG